MNNDQYMIVNIVNDNYISLHCFIVTAGYQLVQDFATIDQPWGIKITVCNRACCRGSDLWPWRTKLAWTVAGKTAS